MENAIVELVEVAAQADQTRGHRETTSVSVDNQLTSAVQANQRCDQSALVSPLSATFDSNKNAAEVQSIQATTCNTAGNAAAEDAGH